MLASALDRSRDSATAQLQGLYGIPFALPLPAIGDSGYNASLPPLLSDYIVSVKESTGDGATCSRYQQVLSDVAVNLGTD